MGKIKFKGGKKRNVTDLKRNLQKQVHPMGSAEL
jgi:hypothetical protein